MPILRTAIAFAWIALLLAPAARSAASSFPAALHSESGAAQREDGQSDLPADSPELSSEENDEKHLPLCSFQPFLTARFFLASSVSAEAFGLRAPPLRPPPNASALL